jgi:hypothetical protein
MEFVVPANVKVTDSVVESLGPEALADDWLKIRH